MKKEVWKNIPGLCGIYQASNHGRIRSLRYGAKIMKPKPNCDGYISFSYFINKVPYRMFAHRAVAICFIPNPKNKPFINHKNFNPADNRVENLEWVWPKENTRHSHKAGRLKKPHSTIVRSSGEKNGNASLTWKKVDVIRELWLCGATQAFIARKFKLAKPTINHVCCNRHWQEKYRPLDN